MATAAEIWSQALPRVKKGVTGKGVWSALNSCKAVALEDGVFVIGLAYEQSNLEGHLKAPQTFRLIEKTVTELLGEKVTVRIIQGTDRSDWESAQRREQEAQRIEKEVHQKHQAKLEARSPWDTVYEMLGRNYAALENKSLAQTRAKYLAQSIKGLAEARKANPARDEQTERSYARCIDRVAQYCEVPGAIIALRVMEIIGET
jgi:hypothetical protein